jgi:hypothetical protein
MLQLNSSRRFCSRLLISHRFGKYANIILPNEEFVRTLLVLGTVRL